MSVHYEQHNVKVKSIDTDPATGHHRFSRGGTTSGEPHSKRGIRCKGKRPSVKYGTRSKSQSKLQGRIEAHEAACKHDSKTAGRCYKKPGSNK